MGALIGDKEGLDMKLKEAMREAKKGS